MLVSLENPYFADSYLVFAASGGSIYAWRRGSELKHIYRPPPSPEKDDEDDDDGDSPPPPPVTLLLPFGPHLISVDANSVLRLWDIKSEDMVLKYPFLQCCVVYTVQLTF